MIKEKQRIAIAEACGWKPDKRGLGWLNPQGVYSELPDYLSDLNAMHEAEKEIIARNKMNGFNGYENTLCGIIDNGNCVNATASQKAEAFLRTLDLWG